jgi:hypothetical protein
MELNSREFLLYGGTSGSDQMKITAEESVMASSGLASMHVRNSYTEPRMTLCHHFFQRLQQCIVINDLSLSSEIFPNLFSFL